ncbi:MAG: glycosyltransferase family 39 protein [Candidatus Pacearchaeota archaeon]|jgi:hypothetical protein
MAIDRKKIGYIILIVILVFAIFLRVYSLSHQSLWVDEAISASASKIILEKGTPVFDSGAFYGRAYVFHYAQAFFLLFGENDFNVRILSVILGLLTVVLAYFVGKEYSKSGGVICALFMSVFYLEVFFSRQARFYQLFQLAFFACLYFLYKSNHSKEKSKKTEVVYLILSLVAFFIALDSQIAALVLAPFLIGYILIYNKPKYLAIIPVIPLVWKLIAVLGLSSQSTESVINYATGYLNYVSNLYYLLIFFIPGVIWSFLKKKTFTLLIILPSLVLLAGVFLVQTFALRYGYFFVFPLVVYSSLLLCYLYEKYDKIFLIAIIGVLLIPSNIFFPYTFVNVIKPIDYNHAAMDYSSPETNYKIIPMNVLNELKNKNNTLISFFSADVEWYIRKPDLVIPFSMDGRGEDEISYNSTDINNVTKIVDIYSGAPIINYSQTSKIKRPYYVTADSFSYFKLKPGQLASFSNLTANCSLAYSADDLKVFECR